MKKIKAIVFDLDGTLLNTIEDLTDALNQALTRQGFPTHNAEACKQFVGNGTRKLVERGLPPGHRDDATIKACFGILQEEYAKNWNHKTHLYDGIPELLDHLIEMAIPLCILTNKPEIYTEKIAQVYFNRWPFKIIRGAREDTPLKPDPTASLRIAAALNLPPDACLHVGDSAVDILTAKAAGMTPIGVTWGFRSQQELTEAGATSLINKPAELLQHLNELS